MDLLDALNEAVAYTDSPPHNEAATCHWVVYPLLQAMGYLPSEIHPQGSDSNGQYPDYTILPSKPECWYVEAKAWSVKLADTHAQQALNYANTGGKRWVVLTNGHIWRLYDNHIHGVAADKFVVEISLCDGDDAVRLFEALRKPAYLSGELDAYARRARLSRTLAQLKDENSAALKALWAALKKEPGLSNLSRSELAAFFGSPSPVHAFISPQSSAPSAQPSSQPAPTAQPKPPPPQGAVPLSAVAADSASYIAGKTPSTLLLPDGTSRPLATWRSLAIEAVAWLASQGKVPALPFKGGKGGKRYFLNSTPDHPSGPMGAYSKITTGPVPFYLDTHRSGWDLASHACRVCIAVGVDPATLDVILS